MAFTQAQLTGIDNAIASGELEVEYDGKRVKYRSMGELMQARATIAADLAKQSGSGYSSSALAEFSRD
jgi:hypothetical protein